jgi:DnaK suppressor protein
MTKAGLEKYREELLALSGRLRGEVTHAEHEALRKTGGEGSGNLSNVPTHPADLATDNFEQETAVSLLENQEQLLGQCVAALRRIRDGSFGSCQECGKQIASERLSAVPYTSYCVDCARQMES